MHLNLRIYFLFFNKFSLYSIATHFYFCKRVCDSKKVTECYCELCSGVYPQIFDLHNTFEDIAIDSRDFSDDFCKFFPPLISLDVCYDSGYFINTRKIKP